MPSETTDKASSRPRIIAIAAMNRRRVIGSKGEIPWHLPVDLKRFSALTTGHTVLMGRKTYESLPPRFRPLPGRKNVIATGNPAFSAPPGTEVTRSAEGYVRRVLAGEERLAGSVLWIIGGQQIYEATSALWDEVHLTLVPSEEEGDAYFPHFEDGFTLASEEPAEGCLFRDYIRTEPGI